MLTTVFSLRAWLEDRITPERHKAQNACVYLGLFSRHA
jgi:hypothetical protein